MIGGMAGFHCDEGAATGCRDLVMCDQLAFNHGAISAGFNHARHQPHRLVRRRRPSQGNLVISGDCAGRMIGARALHQMISSGPVAMTVEQRADDAAAEHPGKCLLIRLGLKFRDYFVTLRKAANVQPLFVRRPATKARIVGRVGFLDAFFSHDLWFSIS